MDYILLVRTCRLQIISYHVIKQHISEHLECQLFTSLQSNIYMLIINLLLAIVQYFLFVSALGDNLNLYSFVLYSIT